MNGDRHCSEVEKAIAVALNSNKPYVEAVNDGFLYLLNTLSNSSESEKTLKRVYVLETDTGLVKIGVSLNPDRRIASIENAGGVSIVSRYIAPPCLNACKIGKEAHRHFAHERKTGEYFLCAFTEAVQKVTELQIQNGYEVGVTP
jgi:hypothetical protein